MRHWLVKSEPGEYSIDDLERDGWTHWDGVRSYQARNAMREMAVGDQVLFYHSAARPPGVAGLAEVIRESYPDFTAWDPASRYHDPASTPDAPRWFMVDISFVARLPRLVALDEIKRDAELAGMTLVTRPRLSVQPVTDFEFDRIIDVARRPGPES
jgi:predicted RNA-binding protein with PUA-like domain